MTSLYSNLCAVVELRPEAPALVGFDGAVTSYGRLLETVHETVGTLSAAARSGRVLGLAVDDPLGFVATYFAAAARGMVVVLLDGQLPATDLERMAAKFDLDFLVRDGDAGPGSIRIEDAGGDRRDGQSPVTDLERMAARFGFDFLVRDGDAGPGSIRIEDAGGDRRDGQSPVTDLERMAARFGFDFLVRDGDAGPGSIRIEDAGADGRDAHAYRPSDFVVHCTSGSTGEPKGIVMSQAAVDARVRSWCREGSLHPDDVVLCALPLWHGHGIDVLTLPTLLAGATVVFARGAHLTARGLARAIHDHAVTIVSGLPVMYQMLVDAQGVDASMLSSLRLALTGSAPISASTQERFVERFGMPLQQGYGLGEIGIIAWDADYAGPGMIGRPVRDIDVRLEPVDADESVFELLVRGPSLARGYYRDVDAERAMFTDGWLRTHDLISVQPEGWSVRGRKSTFINVTGNKVAPIEVEDALRACAEVTDCAVVGVDDGDGGEQVAALIVAAGSGDAEPIRRRVAAHLRPYQLPQLYMLADAVPRTAVGKIDYEAVRRVIEEGGADRNLVAGQPADRAVEWGDHYLTYADLDNAVTALANRITALAPPRSSVLVMGPLCPGYLVGLLATWRAEAVPVPVDVGMSADQYAWIERRVAPSVVISTDVTTACQYAGATPTAAEIVIESGTGTIVLESASERGCIPITFADRDAGYVIPTSGSTGEPKAIVGSRRGLRDFLAWFGKEFGLTREDRCAALTRVNFDPSLRELLGVLGVGGTVVLPPVDAQSDLSCIADHLIDSKPTTVFLVPSVATRLAADSRLAESVLPDIRLIFFAGEVLGRRVIEQWSALAPNAEIVNLYGQTEATLAQVYRRNTQVTDSYPTPVGMARPGIEITIDDDGSGTGEVYLSAETPSLGVLDLESDSVHQIVPIPEPLPTGDLGYFTGNGELVVLGRAGNDIKYGGQRISFHEFVTAVEQLPGVLQCVVVDRSGPHVFVATDCPEGMHATVHGLGRQFNLPRFAVHLQPDLPTLRNGKVDRRALLGSLRNGTAEVPAPETSTQDRSEIEKQLCALLTLESADVSFVDTGVTSLDMLGALTTINRDHGLRLTTHDCFRLRNARGLAQKIREHRVDGMSTIAERTVELVTDTAGDYPLSTRQVAYMRICMSGGNANWCNLSREIVFDRTLTREVVEDAVHALIQRHDALGLALTPNWQRQTYTPAEAMKVSVDQVEVPVQTSTPEFRAGVESARAALVAELIDPTLPPPLRVMLMSGTDGCSVLLAAHHLFIDGPGMDVLVADLRAVVSGGLRDTSAAANSYRSYCVATARSGQRGPAAAYWQTLLAGADQVHLPESTDGDGAAGELLSLPFGVRHTREVHRIAQDLGVSAFTVALGAFETAVSEIFNIQRLPIIVASQHRAGVDSSVAGMFTGTLIVRGSDSATLPGAITALAGQLAEGFEHGDWEFDQRIADLKLPTTDYFPLSTVLFNQRPLPRGTRVRELGPWRPRSLGRSLRYQLQGELQMSGPDMVMTYYYRRGIGGIEIIHRVHNALLRAIGAGQEAIHV